MRTEISIKCEGLLVLVPLLVHRRDLFISNYETLKNNLFSSKLIECDTCFHPSGNNHRTKVFIELRCILTNEVKIRVTKECKPGRRPKKHLFISIAYLWALKLKYHEYILILVSGLTFSVLLMFLFNLKSHLRLKVFIKFYANKKKSCVWCREWNIDIFFQKIFY